MPKKTLALIIGLVIVTVILFVIALKTGEKESKDQASQEKPTAVMQPSPTPFAHTILSLSPNPVEVLLGRQGAVDVVVDPSDNPVTGVQLELQYDPLYVSNVKVSPGELLQKGINLINKNDVKTGRITYLLAIQPNQKPISAGGVIATITFTAKGTVGTQSSIVLLPTTIVTAQGIADSVLKTSSGAVVSIVAATTSAATVTPVQ